MTSRWWKSPFSVVTEYCKVANISSMYVKINGTSVFFLKKYVTLHYLNLYLHPCPTTNKSENKCKPLLAISMSPSGKKMPQKGFFGTILQRCKTLPLAPKALCLEPFCKLSEGTLQIGCKVSFWQCFSLKNIEISKKYWSLSCQKLTMRPKCKVNFASLQKGSKHSAFGARGSVLQRCKMVPKNPFSGIFFPLGCHRLI